MAQGKAGSVGVAGKAISSLGRAAKARLKPAPERKVTAAVAKKFTPHARTGKVALTGKRGSEHALRVPHRPSSASEQQRLRDLHIKNTADAARRRLEDLHYGRHTFSQKQRDAVWKMHFGDAPSHIDISGTRTIYRDDVWKAMTPKQRLARGVPERWQMGHVGGAEHWRSVQDAIDDGLTRDQFRGHYLDLGTKDNPHYRPEHPDTNRSHQHEAH